MARPKKNDTKPTANLGFQAKLRLTGQAAQQHGRCGNKHVILGLIFLKYISDTFEEHRAKVIAEEDDYAGANAIDPDECKTENVFWVSAVARWLYQFCLGVALHLLPRWLKS